MEAHDHRIGSLWRKFCSLGLVVVGLAVTHPDAGRASVLPAAGTAAAKSAGALGIGHHRATRLRTEAHRRRTGCPRRKPCHRSRDRRSRWVHPVLNAAAGAVANALVGISSINAVPTAAPPAGPTPARSASTGTPPPGSIGTLDSSRYRATQLQGDLVASGQGLIQIPSYLTAAGQGITYKPLPGFSQEVPFVNQFQIARFLGAYQPGNQNGGATPASLDYEQRDSTGALVFETNLLKARLQPYLNAGYTPSDITLSVDDVPWAIAAAGGHMGTYGQNNPPAVMSDWATEMTHFASDLKSLYGASAADFRFKIGVEFDATESFNGTAQQYYDLYNTAYDAIRQVIPGADIAPAEFTGTGSCGKFNTATCVYSTTALLSQAAAANTSPGFVPRSLDSFLSANSAFPSAAVSIAVKSYSALPAGVTSEVDQFGLLGLPFGASSGSGSNYMDQGALQANWQFQTIMGLRQTLDPMRISHWPAVDTEGGYSFLNGTGYTHLLLDRYSGSLIYPLDTSTGTNATTEIGGDAFYNNGNVAIVLSSYSPTVTPPDETVSIPIPAGLIPGGSLAGWNIVRYTPTNNVFATIKADLATAKNLNPSFALCGICTAQASSMAANTNLLRTMLAANWNRYQSIMQQTLNLSPLANSDQIEFNSSTGMLTATIPADQLIVLEYGQW